MKNIILILVASLVFVQINFAQECFAEERPSGHFVDICRSLFAVREYLQHNHDGRTWGKVNLVLHSNQWTGMSIPVLPDGERASVETVFACIQEESFLPLENEVVDEETALNFISCGLGKNKDLLYALQLAFGGFDNQQPHVVSSENFVYFGFDERQQVTASEVKPFYAFYKTAYKPADLHLRRQLENRYPKVKIDWLNAMSKKEPANEGDVFHTKFNVPVLWNVTLDVPAERVEIDSEYDKIEFVRAQDDLMEALDKFDIPIEKFRWQMSITEQEGKAQVKIKGKSTVLCVLSES